MKQKVEIKEFIKQLNDLDFATRECATWGLIKIGKDALPYLTTALRNSENNNLTWKILYIIYYIGETTNEINEELIKLSKNKDCYIRFEVINIISKLNIKELSPLLHSALEDNDIFIRNSAKEGLK